VKLSEEWKRLAGVYCRTVDAVRAADWNALVSDAAYGALIDARERAFAALSAESNRVKEAS
jgi:hypothetical protein